MTKAGNTSTLPSVTLPDSLVSTQWLADNLGRDGLLVVDSSVIMSTDKAGRHGFITGHELYLADGHIPSAVFADLISDFSDPEGAFPFTKPSAERFASAAGLLGITEDTAVVIYDRGIGTWATRFWWLLRAFGHDNTAVLDGGLVAWNNEARSTEVGHIEPKVAAALPVTPRPDTWVNKTDVLAISAGAQPATLLCAIPAAEFSGAQPAQPRAGHIPGSISVPASSLIDRQTNRFYPRERLAQLFEGVPEGRVVCYCGGGIAATADAFALLRVGHSDVALYDGSLSEWTADATTPLAIAI